MYGKIFESIFDSTLAAEGGWMPTYIFMSMVVLADQRGIVDVAPKALYRRLGFSDYDSKIAYDDFLAAIEYLQQEDSDSRSPDENGKRVIPLSELPDEIGNRGFKIVNYEYYRSKGSREDRAMSSTERVRKWREKNKKNNDVTQCNAEQRSNAHTDTDTDTNKSKPIGRVTSTKRFDEFWDVYDRKVKRKPALDIWKRKGLDALADKLIADVQNRELHDQRWLDGFKPDPTTYLNQERWDDELTPAKSVPAKSLPTDPYYESIRRAANADNP